MTYCIALDWLALWCSIPTGSFSVAAGDGNPLFYKHPWVIKREQYGTRQFKELHRVTFMGEDFAEVQTAPYSSILDPMACVVRVCNRYLYKTDVWYYLGEFLDEFSIRIESVSRCDICADFNSFKCYECIPFIKDFLDGTIRHKGRGKGAAYFDHRSKNVGGASISTVKYSGLSFGSNESDVRAYLYNKTFELQSVKDKPYIRDMWRRAGLDITRDVWRLEISIKSGGRKFRDKMTGAEREIRSDDLKNKDEVCKLFHTFQRKYFAFVKNKHRITNISREPLIELFDLSGGYVHICLRAVSGGNRTERILIKQLWQMADTYRGNDLCTDEGLTKSLAVSLALSTDLREWLEKKSKEWDKPHKK